MDDLKLKLTSFEGPLDLLLYLVEKDKIDIYDIPIVTITEQYISYLDNLKEFDLDIASNFLGLATILMQLKSRLLLPQDVDEDFDDEAISAVKIGDMLAEYKKVKNLVSFLEKLKLEADKFVTRSPMFKDETEYNLGPCLATELKNALVALYRNGEENGPEAYIERPAFSVKKQMTSIMTLLEKYPEGTTLQNLLSTRHIEEKVATFLGVLELLRLGLIAANQSEQFAPIFLFANPEGNKCAAII